jgi:hypothetical protein
MIDNPIFIVGTERSGSNLLRLLLNEISGIAIPHPPHLMRDLSKVIWRYGDLQVDANFRRLIGDAVQLVRLHFSPWPFELSTERIFKEAVARNLYAVYAAIHEQYLEQSGRKRWGCKSTFMIEHVGDVVAHHAEPQFIHLVRDVRDVAVSARRSVFSHYHPYFVAKLWQREQAKGLSWATQLPAKAWLTVRYEDLIADPESKMREVCRFLGARYNEKIMRFFEGESARELSGLSRSWENVARPVLRENAQKFRRELSGEEIRLIESVAWHEMEALGYTPLTEPVELHDPPSWLRRAQFRLEEEWMMLKEEGKALLKDRNARYRLKKKAYLLTLRF